MKIIKRCKRFNFSNCFTNEADIRRQELLFREGGGLESTIKALRDLGLYVPFETAQEIQGLAKDLSKEEIEEGLGDIEIIMMLLYKK